MNQLSKPQRVFNQLNQQFHHIVEHKTSLSFIELAETLNKSYRKYRHPDMLDLLRIVLSKI